MPLNITDLVPVDSKQTKEVATTMGDNTRQVSVSNNARESQIDNSRIVTQPAKGNSRLEMAASAAVSIFNAGMGIVNGMFSVVNTAIEAYKQIQLSHDRVRETEIQAGAFVRGKEEETRQVEIQQEQETLRHLASLKKDLESKKLELQKFELELRDRQKMRESDQEKWRRKVTQFENLLNPLLEEAKKIREAYYKSNFADENIRKALQNLDEKIYAYSLQLNEIYR